jgi:VWFA-related protein
MIPKHLSDDYILQMKRALQRLANVTGGKVLNTGSFSSLTDVYAQVAEELKNQYYVSYIPMNKKKDGAWRTIELRSRRGDVVLRTRQGYYADGSVLSRN